MDELAAVERAFAERGSPVQAEVSSLAEPAVVRMLTGRGYRLQGALLAARLEIAAEAGCDVAVVITEPGSKSQENVQRHSFELLYTRAILVREA